MQYQYPLQNMVPQFSPPAPSTEFQAYRSARLMPCLSAKAAHQSPSCACPYSLHVAMALPAWFGSGAGTGVLVGPAIVVDVVVVVPPLLEETPTQYA